MSVQQDQWPSRINHWIENIFIPRRLLLLLFLASLFIFELIEELAAPSSIRYFLEIASAIIFFIVLITIWILLEFLVQTTEAKNHAFRILHMKHDLSAQLNVITEWEDMTDLLLCFLQAIVPVTAVSLLAYQPETAQFVLIASRKSGAAPAADALPLPLPAGLDAHPAGGTLHPAGPRLSAGHIPENALPPVYSLPLTHGEALNARLLMYLPPGATLSPDQSDILTTWRRTLPLLFSPFRSTRKN